MLTKRHAARRIFQSSIAPLLFALSCAPSSSVSILDGTPPGCRVVTAREDEADTVRVAVFEGVWPGSAPIARNPSERLVFGHLYETLFGVDCLGGVVPVLAGTWRGERGGAEWVFTIAPEAEFWDGSTVRAQDVASCWRQSGTVAAFRAAGVDSFEAEGDSVVRVHMSRRYRSVPLVLATGTFAVAGGGSRWPEGSGPYMVRPGQTRSKALRGEPVTIEPAPGYRGPVVRFFRGGARDPRDLLESTVDLMLTGDPDVVDYAASRPDLDTSPLPWDRTYVLLSTTRVKALRWGGSPASLSREIRDDLASTAVRAEARGCEGPFWWEEIGSCPGLSGDTGWRPEFSHAAYNLEGGQRILYDDSDGVARDLAERMVALSAAGPGTSEEAEGIRRILPQAGKDDRRPGGPERVGGPEDRQAAGADALIAPYSLSAAGVTEEELESSLQAGEDFAYIVALPSRPADPCAEALSLVERARWLKDLGDRFGDALVPLVETRRHVVFRPGGFGLEIDRFGRLIVTGRAGEEE